MGPAGRMGFTTEYTDSQGDCFAIQMLEAHTVCSNERWIGHPSIPKRVFGPVEYLIDPPIQPTKPKTTVRPLLDDNESTSTDQLPLSRAGSFEATRFQHERSFPKLKEQSPGEKFAVWFDNTFTNWSAKLKQKAIQVSQEAAARVLFRAPHSPREPVLMPQHCQPEAAHGCQPSRMGYKPETLDICYLVEQGSGEHPTIGQAIQQQVKLDKL